MTNLITWRAQMTNEVRTHSRKRNPCPHVSANDRALIEAAVVAGLVTRCSPAFVAPTRQAEMSR
jgi:hypothetical protein